MMENVAPLTRLYDLIDKLVVSYTFWTTLYIEL